MAQLYYLAERQVNRLRVLGRRDGGIGFAFSAT
jgi:hypothetical protein